MKCKNCDATYHDRQRWAERFRHFELAKRYEKDLGDHGEIITEDSGIFCSATCVIMYLERGLDGNDS